MNTHCIQQIGVNGPIRRSIVALMMVYLALFAAALLMATYAIDREGPIEGKPQGPTLPFVASARPVGFGPSRA